MARPAKIESSALHRKLSDVFRDVGYEGASLALLSEATGLQRASLYHRFPGGKEQMALEVMTGAEQWLGEHILAPLASDAPPEARIRAMIRGLDDFYSGGRQACLLNMLSSPRADRGPFARLIRNALKAWIEALAALLSEAGFDAETARFRAERAVALVQGSLVLARGMDTTRPFRNCLANLERELLAPRSDGAPAPTSA
ncbi:MAG: TetR/AcrR family transcriptional regulator [Vicinamibacteria bacterium]|nr:TetR/AcrR family transcriptional regulator [Vicinamibacteria bacterium]